MNRTTWVGAGLLCAGALVTGPAAAQQQEEALDEIVVTGSYISRSTFDSSSPVDFLGQEEFQRQAAISVKDIAQNLSYNIGSENFPDTLRSGATTGTENLNLRGLGLNSTLVLMNGRRQSEAPNLTNDGVAFVDTASMMPTIAVERMEVLKDGAAALYGSDAISGVVNFITRNDFEGFEISVDHQSITDYDDKRPNDWNLQGIIGFGNDRGHVVAAASYLDRAPMPMYERDFTHGGGLSGLGSPGGFFPVQGEGESDAAFGSRAADWQASTFNPNTGFGADLDCENVGFNYKGRTTNWLTNNADPDSPFGAGDPGEGCAYDFLPTQSIIDREERTQFWTHFDYMLDPEHNVEVYGEFHSANNNVVRGNSTTYGFVVQPTVPVSNPGLRNDAFRRYYESQGQGDSLEAQALIDDAAAQQWLGDPDATAIDAAEANPNVGPLNYVGRPFTGNPDEQYNERGRFDQAGKIERNKTHFVGGVRGDLGWTDTWTFDVATTWSEHKFSGFTAWDTNAPNMELALQGYGGRDCDAATGQPGEAPCYFFNPFGSAYLTDESDTGPNGLYNTDELWQDFRDPIMTSSKQKIRVWDAVVTGDAFELPAGTVGLAFGAQHRDQFFESIPSGTGVNFDFSFVVGQEQWKVERDVYAFFGEALVPVTGADSAIGPLELSLALRYEDYGGDTGDTTDPKIAALWMPTDDLSVRASFQTSFKAPGLAQLGGSSTSLNNVLTNIINDPDTDSRSFIPGIAVGNPNLAPEEADVWNAGFSWQPSGGMLDGLEFDFDFWSFAFDGAIRKESNDSVSRAAAAGDPDALAKVTLNPDNTIAVIRSEFINAASVDTQGMDFAIRYPIETDGMGMVNLFWNSTHITEYEFQEAPGQPKVDGLGKRNFQTIGAPAPKWRGNLGADWFLGNHSANLTFRYTHSYEVNSGIDPRIAIIQGREPSDEVDDHLTVDAQYSYQFEELFGMMGPTVSVGAINLFNEDPPGIDTGPGYDTKIHDPRGRVAYASLRMSF